MAAAIGFTAGVVVGAFSSYGWGCAHWAPNWYTHTVVFHNTSYVSHSVTVVNHGYYGYYDHSPTARAYNRQVFVGPNGGVATRTAVHGYGQPNVWGRGPNGGVYDRSTTHYSGGNSSTFIGPNGGTSSRTVRAAGLAMSQPLRLAPMAEQSREQRSAIQVAVRQRLPGRRDNRRPPPSLAAEPGTQQ